MDDEKISEIITYVNKKYSDNVPRPVRFVVRKKVKMIEKIKNNENFNLPNKLTALRFLCIPLIVFFPLQTKGSLIFVLRLCEMQV